MKRSKLKINSENEDEAPQTQTLLLTLKSFLFFKRLHQTSILEDYIAIYTLT